MVNADISRRNFLRTAAVSGAVILATRSAVAQDKPPAAPPLCVFSKHLQVLEFPALAKTCKELRLEGVDLTVRDGGQGTADRAATDLPAAVEAISAAG